MVHHDVTERTLSYRAETYTLVYTARTVIVFVNQQSGRLACVSRSLHSSLNQHRGYALPAVFGKHCQCVKIKFISCSASSA